jgi:hypothetical protein
VIETARPDGTSRKTRIWVVVDGGEAFVRSVRGERGHWYQAAVDAPDGVVIHADGKSIPVRVALAADHESIDRCSAALRSKYNPGGSLDSMLVDKTLGTTLRLEPR